MNNSTVLITGSAGFIGYHTVNRFLQAGMKVVGIDSVNDYYNPTLKFDRLKEAGIGAGAEVWEKPVSSVKDENYTFVRIDLKNKQALDALFEKYSFTTVVHLAAQPGVRYSLQNPGAYIDSNIVGFLNVLEACRHHAVKHLVFASSSSVYGMNRKMPLSTTHTTDHPISLYAATKKSNELMAHTYSHLFNIPTTGLRFFTVYGPWGRPDMATQLFADAISKGDPIKIFNQGLLSRDFTYVADIVEGIFLVSLKPPSADEQWDGENPNAASSSARYKLYNIGNSKPVQLMDFVSNLEDALGKKAVKEYLPMQPGDVTDTFADVTPLQQDFQYQPTTELKDGLDKFAKWYQSYCAL
ncbi:MAG: NAD-dependent epimerase [Saprospiraceae bacterium]|nr:NAD-dependent epimerase [Saprospiraceae bacterium]